MGLFLDPAISVMHIQSFVLLMIFTAFLFSCFCPFCHCSSSLVVLPLKTILDVQQFIKKTNDLMENAQRKQHLQVPKEKFIILKLSKR